MVDLYCHPSPRPGGLRRPGRGVCTGRSPASDLGTVRLARTLSTGSRHHLIVFRRGGPPAGRRAAGRVGVDRRPWRLHAGPGARLVGAVPIYRDALPAGGRMFHDPDFPPSQIGPLPHVGGLGGNLVQLWLGPRLCFPRSPEGPTISAECAVCGVGVPTSWNMRPSAGITSRRMGPESIQRTPRPPCGNTEPRAASPARLIPTAGRSPQRPGARQPHPRPPSSRTRRQSRRNPPRLSTICDTRGGRPVHARRPGWVCRSWRGRRGSRCGAGEGPAP